jgi:hypothetical protein
VARDAAGECGALRARCGEALKRAGDMVEELENVLGARELRLVVRLFAAALDVIALLRYQWAAPVLRVRLDFSDN